ncbi:MAG: hypothetical protein IT384_24850 [Deltaproteobacteria bacterium]|nr:hypothetical protein [Deltaproteobacteria bacterium]
MRRSSLLWLAGLLGGCAAPLRVAPHHQPAEIYERVVQRDAGFTPIASLPRISQPTRLVLHAFSDRVLAPTGSLLSDWESGGELSEVYLTHHLTEHLYDRVAADLARSGATVARCYTLPCDVAGGRILRVTVDHAELHRWQKSDLFGRGQPGTVDVARIDYRYRWSNPEGSGPAQRAAHEMLIDPAQDALDVIAHAVAAELIKHLE